MAAARRFGCDTCRSIFRTGFAVCPIDGTPLQEVESDPLIGTPFAGRYVIEALLGEGGMGRVYLARHHRVSRRFAIKVLYGEHAGDDRMRERFNREAEAASRLEHPNVVGVVDYGETEHNVPYLVMDYVEGRSLETIVATEAPLSTERAASLIRQLALGLEHAHESGLVHRDFKGENVLVATRGTEELPRIVDFGIAVVLEDHDGGRLTTEGIVIGTPAYMSPEQAAGDALDARSDLFSFGVLIYEMLTGVLPFEGTALEMARQNMSAPAPVMSKRVPGIVVDPRLEELALRLMAKDPAHRPQSAAEVAEIARSVLEGHRAESEPLAVVSVRAQPRDTETSTQDRLRAIKSGRGRRVAVIGAGVVLGGLLVLLLFRDRGQGPAPRPVQPIAVPPLAADAGRVATAADMVSDAGTRGLEAAPIDAAPRAVDANDSRPIVRKAPPDAAARTAPTPPPARPDAGTERTPPPPPAAEPLKALYKRVGAKLKKVGQSGRGADLTRRFGDIDILRAMREDTAYGDEVRKVLRSIERSADELLR